MTNEVSSITMDVTTGVFSATGAVTTGVLVIIILLIFGKYIIPFIKWLIAKFDHHILRRKRK